MMYFIYFAAIYVLVIFVLSRLIIPHLGFKEKTISEPIPEEMMDKINQLKNQAENREQFLELAYDYLGAKYRSERFNTFFKFNYLFKTIEQAWQMEGYIPCTVNNYLFKIFLIKSGRFSQADIKCQHVFVNFIIHQYLKVKVGDKWVSVDVGEKQRGLPIGKHLKYFG